jgi:L-rhamnose-proton symport protein (RhaT)
MTTIAATGFALVLLAGLLGGLFALPMKFARGWNYMNIWLIFATTGLVIFPWMLTAATVPHLPSVYRATPTLVQLAILGFGLCWGVAATLTGLAVRTLGIGPGLAIILGLSASVGSLIPLLVLTPGKIHTYQGHIYLGGTAIMLVGIALGARPGYLREREAAAAMQEEDRSGLGSFLAGLMVVTASGLLSSSLNFCYAFGGAAMDQAKSPRRFAAVVLQRDYRIWRRPVGCLPILPIASICFARTRRLAASGRPLCPRIGSTAQSWEPSGSAARLSMDWEFRALAILERYSVGRC